MKSSRTQRHIIRFPSQDPHKLDQNEAHFTLIEPSGEAVRIGFHDYDLIYQQPGLYEQLFYDRLKCCSPKKVVSILKYAMETSHSPFSELRVLDLGAGNGMVGEELQVHGVARIVGMEISGAAKAATERDRPGVYDDFLVADLSSPGAALVDELSGWRFNGMLCVAALGYGDIPVSVFRNAFNLVEDGGWIAFNIKETFLDEGDKTGFSVFIKNLILTSHLSVHHLERYRHRLSIDGRALHYFGIAGRKNSALPESLLPPG